MKQKTHSGAKKRLRVTGSGRVKRRKVNLRHLLSHKSSGRKRHLGMMTYIHTASAYQVERLLVTPRTKTSEKKANRGRNAKASNKEVSNAN